MTLDTNNQLCQCPKAPKMSEASHRWLSHLTEITRGLCARVVLLLWPRLPLCPWASHPEPGRIILYLKVIILTAKTKDQEKPGNHSLSVCFDITGSQRRSHSQHNNGTRRCILLPGRSSGHKTAGGVRDPLLGLDANSHITWVWNTSPVSFPTSLLVIGFPDQINEIKY